MSIFFSIIIPVYNSEKYLTTCIDSVLDQDNIKLEIILINDYSTDKSDKICKDYGEKYEFIRCIEHKNNQGVSKSRNDGIKYARGKFLIFLDSDDYLCKNCLYLLKQKIIKKLYPDLIFGKFIKNTFPYSNLSVLKKTSNFSQK